MGVPRDYGEVRDRASVWRIVAAWLLDFLIGNFVLLGIAVPGVAIVLTLSDTGPLWAYQVALVALVLTFWTVSILLSWRWLTPWGRRRRMTRGKRRFHIGTA